MRVCDARIASAMPVRASDVLSEHDLCVPARVYAPRVPEQSLASCFATITSTTGVKSLNVSVTWSRNSFCT